MYAIYSRLADRTRITQQTTQRLVLVCHLITFRLDYCNGVLVG